ncbi:MAG TPA: hypothetical protein DHV35_03390 [Halieaceae bacterium]|nr:hypothetical protein [Halieaceae bacterium]
MKNIILSTLAFAGLAFHAAAEGLNIKQVPASAQWVIHMDFDGFKTSELGKFAMKQMDEHAGAIDALSAMLKFDPRMDLADVTAFGHVVALQPDENGVVLIRGKFDQEHLLTLFKSNKTFKTEKSGKNKLHSWRDEDSGERVYGSFVSENLLVMGKTKEDVSLGLSTLGGKTKTLKGKELKELKLDPNAYFIMGMASLEGLPIPPQAKMLENVKKIGITMGEKDKNFETNIHLYTANDEFAVQIQQMMQGLLAIVQLQAGNTDNSMAKEAAKFLKDVKISQEKRLVRMSMAIPVATILEEANKQLKDGKIDF